jgi:hypothetical protein
MNYSRAFLAPQSATVELLPEVTSPYRIAARGNDFKPNLATLYDLEDVRGSSPLVHRRFVATRPLWMEARHRVDLDRPFVDFLNVRFAFLRPRASPPQGFVRIARSPGGEVWQNAEVLARAFVPPRVRLVRDGETALEEMAQETDFSVRSWIEMPELDAASAITGHAVEQANGPGRVTAILPRDSGMLLDIELEAGAWIVVSQTAWKGWRARSAGEEIELRFANHAFLGFELPAGSHQVELFYRPRSFEIGLGITLVTLILVAGAGVWRWRRRSSQRTADLREPVLSSR